MNERHPHPPSRKGWLGVVLFVFLLTACGVRPEPTATPTSIATPPATPTSTPTSTPTATPTATPTLTPTPTAIPGPFENQPAIPYPSDEIVQGLGITRYQVVDNHYVALDDEGYIVAQAIMKDGEFDKWQRTLPFDVEAKLVVPHPQESNPELLDPQKSDAPIPQFVNAMRMGGIEVNPQEVANNLQYQTFTGADGKPYVVGAFNLDPDPKQQGETLEGPIPLMMWREGEGWREVSSNVSSITNVKLGVFVGGYGSPSDYNRLKSIQKRDFNFPSVYYDWEGTLEWGTNGVQDDYKTALTYNSDIVLLHPLIWEEDIPAEIKNLAGEPLRKALLEHVTETVNRYPKITYFTLNEITPNFLARIGSEQEQRAFIHEINSILKRDNPKRRLVLNDTLNHGTDSYNGANNERFEHALDLFIDDIDIIGVELSVDVGFPPPQGWEEMIKERLLFYYHKYRRPIMITELSVNIKSLTGENRYLQQAEVYKQLASGIQNANASEGKYICDLINVLVIGDRLSPYERNPNQFGYSPNSDPTLYDDKLNRKLSWYSFISGLLGNIH